MKILRNLAGRLVVMTTMAVLLLPTTLFAQDGELDYGNANEVPLVDGVGLLLIGVLLAALAVWALRRNAGHGHAAGMLLASAALVAMTVGSVNIEQAVANGGPVPLDQPNGVHTVNVPEGYEEYENVTSVTLVILRVTGPECNFQQGSFNGFSGPQFQINAPDYPECVAGLTLQPGEICYTDFCDPG
ncbi:MAG: midcut-by-XrtH protein [Chromatiales bacterium]|jgi:hypothetical protein|nr:midcut-by-XrtH protein [Chromatiales bacterium]MDX9765943.1 midcut-by-XrtH protein [Ectothiorhodospiraceae bacterium]